MASSDKLNIDDVRAVYRAEIEQDRQRAAARSRNLASGEDDLHVSVAQRLEVSSESVFEPAFGSMGESAGSTEEVVSKAKKPSASQAAANPQPASKPLDAYWASYGSPVARAVARFPELAPERVIGQDDRVKITATEDYPWRCICALRMTDQQGQGWIGTGWLVSPRLLVTAGHCVYAHDPVSTNGGAWMRSIEVVPGRNGDEQPFGSVWAQSIRSVRGWTRDKEAEFDYGAILLPEDARLGERLGWLGYANREDDYIEGRTLNISGYPGDLDPYGFQWWHAQAIETVGERTLRYEIDTFGGQSGAPVWERTSEGHRYGLGIHNYGLTSSNQATRITASVYQSITNWIAEVP